MRPRGGLPFALVFEPIQEVTVPPTIRLGSAFAWLLTACPPFPESGTCEAAECLSTSAPIETSAPQLPTTGGDMGGFQTVTGNEPASTGAPEPATETVGTSTGEPQEPPAIVQFKLTPETIMVHGPIDVTVMAAHADGVHMVLDNGDESELKLVKNGEFSGSFDVLTGFDNGEHFAHLTPWRDAVVGAEVLAPYTITLPEPGSPLFWETSDELGPGEVVALGVLPDGQVVEFGTRFSQGQPRCYLRRRDKQGAVNDTTSLLGDNDCTAVDLQVDDKGALFVLVHRTSGDGVRWWYGKISAWGKGATPVKDGEKGESAVALALHPSGAVAVCGFAPTIAADVDAMVHVFAPNDAEGKPLKFDYRAPPDYLAHWFEERPRDCVYTGDTLALVGEAYGRHLLELVKRERLFVLRVDPGTGDASWMVAPPGVRVQSGAQAVDVDEQGRVVVAGYTCDDVCAPEGELRMYDADDTLIWQVSLGAFQSKTFAVKDVAWSPAGYAVVATGGLKGAEGAFTVQAFAQKQVPPLWAYTHKDIMALDLALALAIGRYGEVYAGGVGVNSYPAVAYIGG